MEFEYGLRLADGEVKPQPTREMAEHLRDMVKRSTREPFHPGARLVRRQVTPWEDVL